MTWLGWIGEENCLAKSRVRSSGSSRSDKLTHLRSLVLSVSLRLDPTEMSQVFQEQHPDFEEAEDDGSLILASTSHWNRSAGPFQYSDEKDFPVVVVETIAGLRR